MNDEPRYPISQREREEQEYRADVMRREVMQEQKGQRMNVYTVEVEAEQAGRKTKFTITSTGKIDERLLKIAGMLLDGGYGADFISPLLPLAQMYATAKRIATTEGR